MNAEDFLSQLQAKLAGRPELRCDRHPLRYAAGDFELIRLASASIDPDDRVVLIQAGIHGDELAGPLTFLHELDRVIEAVHGRGLRLIAYPLANPSGFSVGTRYNIDRDAGEDGNGDFIRYRSADDRWQSDPDRCEEALGWRWSSDPELALSLPAETALLHRLLRADPLAQVRVALDLHQDHLSPGLAPAAYHYAFGDLRRYHPIVRRIERQLPLLRHHDIAAGYGVVLDERGRVAAEPDPSRAMRSDQDAFVVRHDGTLCDLFYRLGTPLCVTAETTGATPLPIAREVNLAWIEGLAQLAADG